MSNLFITATETSPLIFYLKHLSRINDSTYFKSPLKLDESDIEQQQKEYPNQHWYHSHRCLIIDRLGLCQISANVSHKDDCKLRDSTFYYRKRLNIEYYYSLIMGSNAPNGSFYVTNALDIKHETICETNYNGILLGGRLSI
ncbi:unnamed protein product [Rotaria sordida]|uniref:Uncharacterized protein n=1 Tax=Rotaria sordida TaxID=392033 RepID=A0A819FTT4_9BILA|nr:unnamed protein product [Rotaria sordida]